MKTDRASRICRRTAVVLVLTLVVFMLEGGSCVPNGVRGTSELETYVHDFVDVPPYGNWTFVEKPMFPVYLNQSQIPVGANWTVVYPLIANRSYHVYCYGEWVDFGSNPSTDYDIYVYDPLGHLEGYHTESTGFPEHLGSTVDEPFFVPKYSGNYSFVIRNDPRESNASRSATLMNIEDVKCNEWHEVVIEGKENDTPLFKTSWAFEFVTESPHVEVWVKVPETLDMYEARLFLMSNPEGGTGEILNGVPLAWEQGLYGDISGIYGGYNLESTEFRGLASASCEFYGENMLVNYTSSLQGKSLYHLVLVGEEGTGKIEFLVKTEFGNACLKPVNPPLLVYPDNETTLTFVSNITDLTSIAFYYSVDDWKNLTALSMELIDNRTSIAVIPGQPAGTTVKYKVEGVDVLENVLTCNGSYTVKYASQLDITLEAGAVLIGENITVTGLITPPSENVSITLIYTSTNGTFQQTANAIANGTFTASFKPPAEVDWHVQAVFEGNNMLYGSSSPSLKFTVEPPSLFSQYSMYIFAGAGAGIAITAIVYVAKRRE
ncbi:MAG: hypothetical protein JSW29_02580 [Candidatus Bathyarchaeota archaeon]|nr:MAG: hypothetical protein JSW29_02580 [Candidatus Bathyarchaeota archaeon]